MIGIAEDASGTKLGAAAETVNRSGGPRGIPAWGTLVVVVGMALGGGAAPLRAQAVEGERLVVRGLDFKGNEAIDDYTLSVSIGTSNSSWWERTPVVRWIPFFGEKRYFNEREFRQDVLRIELLYKASGYYDVRVDTTVERSEKNVSLAFRIAEGRPVRVTSLSVSGAESILTQRNILERLPLKVGDPFNRFRFQASADTLRAALRNRGYPFAEVFRNFDQDLSAYSTDVSFEVLPGALATVDSIEVTGNQEYSEKVIRRVLSFREDQIFSQTALSESHRALYRLSAFNYVSVSLKDSLPESPDDSLVTVQVQVSEGPLRTIRLGAGYGTIDCFRTRSSWTLNNFMGDAQTLAINANVSRIGAGDPLEAGFQDNICSALGSEREGSQVLNFNVGATFHERFLFDRQTSAQLSVFGERHSEFRAFLREAVGGELSITRQTPWRIPVTGSYSLTFGRTDADPVTFCTFLNVCDLQTTMLFTDFRLRSAVSLAVVRDRTDSPLNPTSGSIFRVDMRHASKAIGSDTLMQFTKGVADLAAHYRTGRGSVMSWRVRLGGVVSPGLGLPGEDDRFIPPEERFFAGGANTVRGFGQNELGPIVRVLERVDTSFTEDRMMKQDTIARTSPSGGDAILLVNAELRFPLSRRLSAALFVDAGQVFDRREAARGAPGLRVTPGIGIRLVSPIGPIRLDVGFNPYDPEPSLLFREEGAELVPVTDEVGDPIMFTPGRDFIGRLRLHFSIGQPF
jgi:outer membrane protein assembly complex protein YaeT